MIQIFKNKILQLISTVLEKKYEKNIELDKQLLEYPPDKKMGHLAFPCFSLAKILKKSPVHIAQEMVQTLRSQKEYHSFFSKIENNKAYLNFFLNLEMLKKCIMEEYKIKDWKFASDSKNNDTVVLDYSSPNIAKPFSIAHLITTALGETLKRIYKYCGYKTVGINYLGDWGTQFGKMILAFQMYGNNELMEKRGVDYLVELYVKFHKEEENDPELTEKARNVFLKLEKNDKEIVQLWQYFKDISLRAYNKVYDLMGINFDYIEGESFYNEKMEAMIQSLREKQLLRESEGALVVDVDQDYKENIPPCLIKKSDGATLYTTRDITALFDRYKRFQFNKILYVVDLRQSLHFKQVFSVVTQYMTELSGKLFHVPFGTMTLCGEKLATRKGNLLPLKQVYDKVYAEALKITNEKNIADNTEHTAHQLAVGALNFSILKNKRVRDIDFDWKTVLSFEGETSVYLQYTIVRLRSILNKLDDSIREKLSLSCICVEETEEILIELAKLEEIFESIIEENEPFYLTRFLLELAKKINLFYSQYRVLSENETECLSRASFCHCILKIMETLLVLLNIPIPERL